MRRRLTHTRTVTSKYQITLPIALRRSKGFERGDRFAFSVRGPDEFVAVRLRPSRLLDVAGDLDRRDREGASRA